ncbi:MAG: hypothetical protein ACREEH_01450 [Caulobacteraceae bacterium]
MADLTAARRRRMKPNAFAGTGRTFPNNDALHARLAIGGATRSYHAGNIGRAEMERIQAAARAKLKEN